MEIKGTYRYILTADIGGSHITVAVCDTENNALIEQSYTRLELSSKGLANDILNTWAKALKSAAELSGVSISGVALAMPGPFDYENGISYITGLSKYEALYGMNIKEYVAGLLELDSGSVRFRNDAEATIAGEVLAGAGRGYNTVLGITLGTGFGSAYYNGAITRDLNLGSQPFQSSIADDYLSTRWFLKRYYEDTGISAMGVKELASRANSSRYVKPIFKKFAINMGDFLAAPISVMKPEILVICGNIAKASAFFLPQLKKQLKGTPIEIASLGEQAALIGASGLFDTISDKILDPYNSI